MEALERVHQSDRKRLEGRLSLNREKPAPVIAQQLPSDEQINDSSELTGDQRLEAALWDERNRWSIDRLRSGQYVGERKISKGEAARLWGLAMRTMEGGDEIA